MRLRVLAGAFFLVSATALAQEPVRVAVSVVVAVQPKAPVRVVSIERRPLESDLLITVENVSSKLVRRVQVAMTDAVPEGCLSAPGQTKLNSGGSVQINSSDDHLEMVPKMTATFRAGGILTAEVNMPTWRSRYLQVQLGVQRVEFLDGTTWERTGPESLTIFDPALLRADTAKCKEWPWVDGSLPWDSVQIVNIHPAPKGTPPIKGSRYDYFCEVKGNTAICNM